MPVYDYMCETCGPFTALRPMAQCSDPCACPDCQVPAARAYLNFPSIAGMDSCRRKAFATNERNAHSPTVSRKADRESRGEGRGHAPGCACCSGGKGGATVTRDGAKSFPSKRPWMISH